MDTKEIIVKIQNGLKKSSVDNNISWNDIRIKLSIVDNAIKCTLMNKKDNVRDNKDDVLELNFKDLLSLSFLEAIFVNKFLKSTLSKISKSEGFSESTINARICTRTEDFTPSVYLFNANAYVREVTMQELIS